MSESAELKVAPDDWATERGWLRRLMWLAPLGLAIDIVLSLWVSRWNVTHSVIMQVEPEWRAGERLAMRAQLVDGQLKGVDGIEVGVEVVDGSGKRFDLGSLPAIAKAGLNQGAVEVPAELTGPRAQVHFSFVGTLADGKQVAVDEEVSVEVVDERSAREPIHRVAASNLQWADDTDEQLKDLRIDAMPYGRLLAGFDNEILIRLTDPEGRPLQRKVEVKLVSGEFKDEVGPGVGEFESGAESPTLYEGRSDPWGLLRIKGRLDSDVIRFEVQVHEVEPPGEEPTAKAPAAPGATGEDAGEAKAEPPKAKTKARRFRMVSFSGGVRLSIDRQEASLGGTDPLKLEGISLTENRPIFVDVHGPKGAWIDTFMPPLRSFEPAREWKIPAAMGEGLTYFEGYSYTNTPGQSTEVLRVWMSAKPSDGLSAGMLKLRSEQIDELSKDEAERERKYLEVIEAQRESLGGDTLVGRWMMASLPIAVYGPPESKGTRVRDDERLAKARERWTMGLRAFLWGGGALTILLTGVMLYRQQRRLVTSVQDVLDDEDAASAVTERKALLLRGAVVLVFMGSALFLLARMLESLVWNLPA
jgi:hypothetical protein